MTNRQRLIRVRTDINQIRKTRRLSPSAAQMLERAALLVEQALTFPLDKDEVETADEAALKRLRER